VGQRVDLRLKRGRELVRSQHQQVEVLNVKDLAKKLLIVVCLNVPLMGSGQNGQNAQRLAREESRQENAIILLLNMAENIALEKTLKPAMKIVNAQILSVTMVTLNARLVTNVSIGLLDVMGEKNVRMVQMKPIVRRIQFASIT